MQVKQRFVVAHPRAVVWDFFGRTDEVTLCMPGASLTQPAVGNFARFKLNVRLGPIAAAFVGEAESTREAEDFRGIICGSAHDNRGDSRVKGAVDYVLSEEADGQRTCVDISVDFSLTGRLAQFSRAGVVNDLAGRLSADFANNLETALNSANPPTSTLAPNVELASRTAPRVSELRAGRLLASVVWSQLKALLRPIFRR